MGNDVNSGNVLGVQGFVQIEVVNEKTGGSQTFKSNTVTNLGKQFFLAKGVGSVMGLPTLVERGCLYPVSTLGAIGDNAYGGCTCYADEVKTGLLCYLVNTQEELTPASTVLPVFDDAWGVDYTKVIGYAGFNRSVANASQGVIDVPKDEYVAQDMVVSQRWRFDDAQAVGTFNKLCIGAGVIDTPLSGLSMWKGVDGLPSHILEDKELGGFMCPPSVTGLTSAHEILVDDCDSVASERVARHVINLVTGTRIALAPDDERYGVALGRAECPHLISSDGRWFRYTTASTTITCRTLATGVEENCSWTSTGTVLFEWDDHFYTARGTLLYAYNRDTLKVVSSKNISYATISDNIPSYLKETDFDDLSICSTGGVLYVSNVNKDMWTNEERGLKRYDADNIGGAVAFTDLQNIAGSIVDVLPTLKTCNIHKVGVDEWIFDRSIPMDFPQSVTDRSTGFVPMYGVKVCKRSQMGSMLSFVNLASPITKTADDVLYVSYGYKFV